MTDDRLPNEHVHLIDKAAKNGNLDEIKRLHAVCRESCSDAPDCCWADCCWANAMDLAARHGRLSIVEWLHRYRGKGCSTFAMDWAAQNGHLHVVQWLHLNRSEGCTTWAMDSAAANGHLNVFAWLQFYRTEGFTASASKWAAAGKHWSIVRRIENPRLTRIQFEAILRKKSAIRPNSDEANKNSGGRAVWQLDERLLSHESERVYAEHAECDDENWREFQSRLARALQSVTVASGGSQSKEVLVSWKNLTHTQRCSVFEQLRNGGWSARYCRDWLGRHCFAIEMM